LLGCDYLEPIKGVGPKTAYKLIQEHQSLEKVLEHLREKYVPGWTSLDHTGVILIRHFREASKQETAADDEGTPKKKKGGVQIPENWPWEEAKQLFLKPDVLPADEVEVRVLVCPSVFSCSDIWTAR
jgi:flap endonuclease-1